MSPFGDIVRRDSATYDALLQEHTNVEMKKAGEIVTGGTRTPRAIRILIADDDRDTALTLMVILQDEGYEVGAVHSGRSLVSAVIATDPDVVIADINMPDMSGWQAAQTIRARDEKRPLLIGISGVFTKAPDKILGHISGFDHYLVKPCAPAELLAILAPLRTPGLGEPRPALSSEGMDTGGDMTVLPLAQFRPSKNVGRSSPRLRILIADDNNDALTTLSTLLVDDGYDVKCVSRGLDALRAEREYQPQVVILDLRMPDVEGYDLARWLRSRHRKNCPLLIAITGHYTRPGDRELAQEVGFDHYLVKPYDIRQLVSMLTPLMLAERDSA